MSEVIRNRTIRPSSRLETSKSYKIDTKSLSNGDTLVVNIDHETEPFKQSFQFKGSDVAIKDSISFRVNDYGTRIDISWSGAQPIDAGATSTISKQVGKKIIPVSTNTSSTKHNKKSFSPLVSDNTEILILGTMPGDRSLQLGEYYAHPRNRFWKIIATITGDNLPSTYEKKKKLLTKHKVGLWDITEAADREGSLDTNITNAIPNDIDSFLKAYKKIKLIGFNGGKSAALFAKFFVQKPNIIYLNLPSTSPANTGIDFEQICKEWKRIMK
jgi:hypoxanthine-DNA glycosylase